MADLTSDLPSYSITISYDLPDYFSIIDAPTMANIFLTGATGYIGGTVLSLLVESHPKYSIRALVRDEAKGKLITDAFKNVEVVIGDLDSADVLAGEVSKADVVVHLAASGHLKSVETIHEAIASKPSTTHWIQISGASALAAGELADESYVPGSASDLIFNDLAGISELHSFIRRYPSRAVDNYVLDVAAGEAKANTALVLPPIIYGKGTGPGNKRSVQIPSLASVTLRRGRGLQVGEGLSRWGNVHVKDVARLFVRLVEKAVEGNGEKHAWNDNGVYLAGVGELSFGEISKLVVSAALEKGLISSGDVDVIGAKEADSLLPYGTVLFGTNARGEALRAKEVLGWTPTEERLQDEIPKDVEREVSVARRL
ncbi:nad dependent epimerase dehydratase family protein [Colletotrichum plurivorum]|uniref:Nad dependent epimerase dehydratase family protein n=1 Tax=Colletotrichum plurivorum TaxID=2175906 RepID=A0A8H6JSJ7_9PEZI|nr:nad dependent epimerase dehydratase family protein [Colletotrichum plurivorum]